VTVDARHGAEWTASVRQVLRRLTIRTTRWNRLVSRTIAIQAQPSSVPAVALTRPPLIGLARPSKPPIFGNG
jgi:hypothetical protein